MGVVHGYLLIKLAKYCAYLVLLLFFQALIFFGEVLLFMNWAPVGDMVLVRQKHSEFLNKYYYSFKIFPQF